MKRSGSDYIRHKIRFHDLFDSRSGPLTVAECKRVGLWKYLTDKQKRETVRDDKLRWKEELDIDENT